MDVEARNILLRLKFGATMLLVVLLGGTVGFWYFEKGIKTFLDSFLFTLVTITTIGYGDVTAKTIAGKILNIVVIFLGVGAVFATIPAVFEALIGKKIKEVLMVPEKTLDKTDHYIVCGYGKFGKALARSLKEQDKPFAVIENNGERVREMVRNNIPVIEGDAKKEDVLKRAGIKKAQYLLASLDDASNVFTVLTAKMINSNVRVICKIEDETNAAKLKKAGADEVVCCHDMGAQMMMRVAQK